MNLGILKPYVKKGIMPNFSKIMNNGSCGNLYSTIPPVTGPAWTSMVTGKNPGKHGIFEFRTREGYKTKVITKSVSAGAEPLWNILSRNGKKVIVVNVPFTYPPDEVNGIMISGMMTPGIDKDFVFPRSYRKKLFKLIPDYRLDIDVDDYMHSNDKNALMKQILKVTRDVRRLMDHLLEEDSWDFFFTAFTGPDRLQHFMWDDVVSMHADCVEYFRLLDEILGDILAGIDDDVAVFISSDHGFTAINKFFSINRYFEETGLLKARGNRKPGASHEVSGLGKLVGASLNLARSLNVKKYLPVFMLKFIRKYVHRPEMVENEIDWKQTKVFSIFAYGIVFLNLKGREPEGIVAEQEYGNVCALVEKELLGICDPETGKHVVKKVYRGKEIYSPDHSNDRPDLVVVMEAGYLIYTGLERDVFCANTLRGREIKADHHRNGIFMAYGKFINSKRTDADICDVMPTILYLMGLAIPEDVDGRILTEIVDGEFLARNKSRFEKAKQQGRNDGNSLGDKEMEELQKQLKNLGYLG